MTPTPLLMKLSNRTVVDIPMKNTHYLVWNTLSNLLFMDWVAVVPPKPDSPYEPREVHVAGALYKSCTRTEQSLV